MDIVFNFYEDTVVYGIPYDEAKLVAIRSVNLNPDEVNTIIIKLNRMIADHQLHGNLIHEINKISWLLNIL